MRKIALGVALGVIAALALSAVAAPPSSYVFRGLVGLVDAVTPATTAEGQMAMYRATPTGDHTCLLVDANGAGYTASGGGGGGGDVNLTEVGGAGITLGQKTGANSLPVVLSSDFPLPAGSNLLGAVSVNGLPNEGQQLMAGSISVAIASDQSSLPTSVSSYPGPADAKFPSLVSGRIPVDGSGVTQPVSGTVTVGGSDNDVGNFDLEFAGTASAVNAGVANAQTQRVILASDGQNGYIIPGHTGGIGREVTVANSDGALTNASLVGTIAGGTCVEVYGIQAVHNSDTAIGVRVGFGATTVPAASLAGTNGILLSHPGIASASGEVKGVPALRGASGEELRATTTAAPSSGEFVVITFEYREVAC